MKLPKQWKYWCRKYGLKPQRYSKSMYSWFYLEGYNRVWRVNCHNKFEVGDLITEFDRWGLCEPISSVQIPKTEKEFDLAIVQMNLQINENDNV